MTAPLTPRRTSGALDALPAIPRDAEGPVFRAPWEAQAFAMAVILHERGHFTWKEWAARLADEIAAARRRGEPDDGSRYYYFWLAALEKLVADKGLVMADELAARKDAWDRAARATPHGQPIELPRNA
jgi:nitrile hydratase accessory protein